MTLTFIPEIRDLSAAHAASAGRESIRLPESASLRDAILAARSVATGHELCGIDAPCAACRREADVIAVHVLVYLYPRLWPTGTDALNALWRGVRAAQTADSKEDS